VLLISTDTTEVIVNDNFSFPDTLTCALHVPPTTSVKQ